MKQQSTAISFLEIRKIKVQIIKTDTTAVLHSFHASACLEKLGNFDL
jgi:hypothetical protein